MGFLSFELLLPGTTEFFCGLVCRRCRMCFALRIIRSARPGLAGWSGRERRSAAKDRTALRMLSAVLTENDVQEVFDLTRSEPVLVHKTLGSVLKPTLSERFSSLSGNCIAEDQQWYQRKTHLLRSLRLVRPSFRWPEGRNRMSRMMSEVVVIFSIGLYTESPSKSVTKTPCG